MGTKDNNREDEFCIRIYIDVDDDFREEAVSYASGLDDAFFEANELAVEMTGFTLDNWKEAESVFIFKRDDGSEYQLIISRSDSL